MRKRSPTDLALFGGAPAFGHDLHVGHVGVGARDGFLRYVNEAFERRWLTNDGPLVRRFEDRIGTIAGVEHCVATCNATLALGLLARALDIRRNAVLPSLTFVATAHAMKWHGVQPAFCDVARATHLADPGAVAAAMTHTTGGIVGVHLWGRACDAEALVALGRDHGVPVIFDAAHALGASHGGRPVGSFGDAEVFSFHATKFLHTFEGGAVVTRDKALADELRLLRNFGFAGPDEVVVLGINAKMSEISAAMGLASLDMIDELFERNLAVHTRYVEGLGELPGLRLLRYPDGDRSNHQYVVLEIEPEVVGLARDQLLSVLQAERLLARRYPYPGCHRMEPYRTENPGAGEHLPNTEAITERVLQLPAGAAISSAEIDVTCDLMRFILDNAGDIADRMSREQPEPAVATS